VRRRLADWRSLKTRRLPPRALRQHETRSRAHPGGCVPHQTSAELAANQFDPFDYWVVAPIVGELVERRTSPAALVHQFEQHALDAARFVPDADGRTAYDKHTVETFSAVVYDCYRRLRRSVYKRLQGPPIVVITERAFGFDLRETIINGWEG
jgi:NAD+ synthase (glutamine-hydrolysing)